MCGSELTFHDPHISFLPLSKFRILRVLLFFKLLAIDLFSRSCVRSVLRIGNWLGIVPNDWFSCIHLVSLGFITAIWTYLKIQLPLFDKWKVPWVMYKVVADILELWTPIANIVTFWVELLWLEKDVEDWDSARANACGEVPATVVCLNIMVNEDMLKVVGAEPPILLQVHCQVARHDLSSPIRHPTRLVHFSH